MIADWRYQWGLYSDTTPDFPFGFVQLSVWNDEQNTTGWPIVGNVRWSQTANFGFIPNPFMPNVFGATAIDLG